MLTIRNARVGALSSHLVLAGVHLKGTQAAVKGVGSKLNFSASRISRPLRDGRLHGFKSKVDEAL